MAQMFPPILNPMYEYNLYVEYWGRDDTEYVESRQFKEQVYKQLTPQRGRGKATRYETPPK